MVINSRGDIRQDLLEKYAKTKDKKYLQEWKETEAPVVYAMRLSNKIIGDYPYLSEMLSSGVNKELSKKIEVLNPDVLSYAYLMIGHMIDSWDPDKAQLGTFIYGYVKQNTVREIYSDLNKSSVLNGEASLDIHEEYNPDLAYSGEVPMEYIEMIEELKTTIGKWAREIDIHILEHGLGEITTEEALDKMGYKYRTSFYKRKAHVYELAYKYLQEEQYI